MNTLQEKIEILKAMDKGLTIQYSETDGETDDWEDLETGELDFGMYEYRVKPKSKPKSNPDARFKIGDVLVRRSDEGKPIKDNENYLFTIEEADQDAGLYFLSNGQALDMETAHSDYLDAFGSKVLWYWEIKTDGDWSMPTATRKTFQEVIELTSNDNKPVTQRRALYSLGFEIKE